MMSLATITLEVKCVKGVNLWRLEAELAARDLEMVVVTSPMDFVYVSEVPSENAETCLWSVGVRNAAVMTRSGETMLIVADSSQHQVDGGLAHLNHITQGGLPCWKLTKYMTG